jgi:ribose transport system substrate-binding protein
MDGQRVRGAAARSNARDDGDGRSVFRRQWLLRAAFVAASVLAAPTGTTHPGAAPSEEWTGPTNGPSAVANKAIAVLAEDLRNGGILGVAQGVREAAREIGWKVRIFDAGGTAEGVPRILGEALSARADGLVLLGKNAHDFETMLRASAKRPPPVVAWHSDPAPGPVARTAVAMNVTTDPKAVARAAALAVVSQSGGRAGVVIFTDSRFTIALAKSQVMADVIRQCAGCTLLAIKDVPIAESAARTPAVTRELLAEFGSRWTYGLAINDIYFDHAVPVFLASGVSNGAIRLISAGDGSLQAFERIRAGLYQTATVPEPLNMQGWQMVDELNRLFAGQPVSGYVPPVHLVTAETASGRASAAIPYDPDNGYRDIYRHIWRKPRPRHRRARTGRRPGQWKAVSIRSSRSSSTPSNSLTFTGLVR